MERIKLFLQSCSDGQSLFKDIDEYTSAIAQDVLPWRRLPFQAGGNGCALHCIAFAANLLTQHHVRFTDADTVEMRMVVSSVLWSEKDLGAITSHENEEQMVQDSVRIKQQQEAADRMKDSYQDCLEIGSQDCLVSDQDDFEENLNFQTKLKRFR